MTTKSEDIWPKDVGILAMDMYFPSMCLEQKELEVFDGVSQGKYTVGLGQTRMAVVSDREDIHSFCLTVVHSLIEKAGVCPKDIGFLMVGTETLIDEVKSVKSMLMRIFAEHGNNDIQGSDTTNACYGGTAALFHALDWIESSNWDGRKAIVVAADLALYSEGSARPTSGAGAVAMLIGPNAPLIFERGLRATHMAHVYDFYKPRLDSEYPYVDGKLSINCYYESLDKCYELFKKKYKAKYGVDLSLNDFSGFLFHAPYCKLVQKSFARLILNECLEKSSFFEDNFCCVQSLKHLKIDEKFTNKEVEDAFVKLSKPLYESNTKIGLILATDIGNMYTASLYGCLISYLLNKLPYELKGNRLLMYSYGSGMAASLFALRITDVGYAGCPLNKLIDCIKTIPTRLENRKNVTPQEFVALLKSREESLKSVPFTPKTNVRSHFPKTYVLDKVDEMHRRHYIRVD